MNVCTSSEMLAILSSAKNTCLDIVHKWRLGFDILSNFRHNINMVTSFHTFGQFKFLTNTANICTSEKIN